MPHRLTVRQNLRVFAQLYGVIDSAGKIARLAEDLALVEFLESSERESLGGTEKHAWLSQEALINILNVGCSMSLQPRSILIRGLGARLSRDASARPQLHDFARLA